MTADERLTVVGVFQDPRSAERAVDDLRDAGFSQDVIGFAVHAGTAPAGVSDHSGRALVTVRANERYLEAAGILNRHGGYDMERGRRPAATPAPAQEDRMDRERTRDEMSEARAQAYAAHPLSQAIEETAVESGAAAAGTPTGSLKELSASGEPDMGTARTTVPGSSAAAESGRQPRPDAGEVSPTEAMRETADTAPRGEAGITGYPRSTPPSVHVSGEGQTPGERQTTDQPGPARRRRGARAAGRRTSERETGGGLTDTPEGVNQKWPVRAGDPLPGKFVEGEEQISTTSAQPGARFVAGPDGERRAPDAAEARGPYIDPGEDLERVGATSGLASQARISSWADASTRYRQQWQTRRAADGGRWEDAEPAYRYGHEMATDPRYQERAWSDAQSGLRAAYAEWCRRRGYQHEERGWERHKQHVREAWDSVRGQG